VTKAAVDNAAQLSRQRWSWLFTFFKFGLSALAFALVLFWVDLRAAWEHVLNQSPKYLIIAAALFSLQIVLGALRWHSILGRLGAKPSARESIRLYYISAFFNSYLWGAVGGDVVRAWLTYRGDVSGKTAVNSVILDRIAALAGVAILAIVTAPTYLSRVGNSLQLYIPIAVAIGGLAGIAVLAQLERLPEVWLRARFVRLLHSLGGSVRLVFLSPKAAAPTLAFAIAAQLALGAATYAVAQSLDIDVTALDCIVLMQPVALLANLPISIGGWGVRETAMIFLFGFVGVPASAALILSVQLGLLSLLVVLPGGILWLLLKPKDRVS
jgi:uncharacterized protein (TIRG00374 family)